MAISYMSIGQMNLFIARTQLIIPGCKAFVDFDDLWKVRYRIEFMNGVKFSGDDSAKVLEEARVYATSVKNLTGEWP